jgi:hypothetical protein
MERIFSASTAVAGPAQSKYPPSGANSILLAPADLAEAAAAPTVSLRIACSVRNPAGDLQAPLSNQRLADHPCCPKSVARNTRTLSSIPLTQFVHFLSYAEQPYSHSFLAYLQQRGHLPNRVLLLLTHQDQVPFIIVQFPKYFLYQPLHFVTAIVIPGYRWQGLLHPPSLGKKVQRMIARTDEQPILQ